MGGPDGISLAPRDALTTGCRCVGFSYRWAFTVLLHLRPKRDERAETGEDGRRRAAARPLHRLGAAATAAMPGAQPHAQPTLHDMLGLEATFGAQHMLHRRRRALDDCGEPALQVTGFISPIRACTGTPASDKKGKPFFPEGARCRIVPRARAPQLAAPVASQVATTGGSGRRPLSERPPPRSLGQCSALAESPVIAQGLLLGGCRRWCWVRGADGIARPRRPQTSMPTWAVVCGLPSIASRARWHGGSFWLGARGGSCCCLELFGAWGGRLVRSGGEGAAIQHCW